MTTLLVAPCSRDAARKAVERWHYSHAMPTGRLVCFGVWESGDFRGVVLFGRGANDHMLSPYGLTQAQGCELVRVALREHDAPVSQIVAEALRLLRASSPGLRLVVSFADPEHGHHGGIYQAGNWLYLGLTELPPAEWVIGGRRYHARSVSAMNATARGTKRKRPGESREQWLRRTIDARATAIHPPRKHRYVMPLDAAMRRKLKRLARPYPRLAVEASSVTRPPSGWERQVRPLSTAQDVREG